ncbi:MAG: hypothetical protein K2M30_00805 [Desulfovibrionaceae bacterium]|nr:hypothetical protein [Desulfovibrionaceae bacterium]
MLRLLTLILLAVQIIGCDSNQAVRQFYYKYLDPPPTISLEATKAPWQEVQLSEAVLPIDQKLTAITRFLAVYDKVGYDEWIRSLATRFPWIQGAAIISPDGAILFANPEGLFSNISLTPLTTVKTTGIKLQQKAMFYPVNTDDAFLFIGQPVFTGEELVEYRVVAIALSALSSFTPLAQKLYFIGNESVLWRGNQTHTNSIAFTTNWKRKEYYTVSGLVKDRKSNTAIEYIIIYIGPVPFIIAIDVSKQ